MKLSALLKQMMADCVTEMDNCRSEGCEGTLNAPVERNSLTSLVSSRLFLTASQQYCVSFDDVVHAARRIDGLAHKTPVMTCTSINQMASNRRVYFKLEALQKTGSFKFRGACNAMRALLSKNASEAASPNASEAASSNASEAASSNANSANLHVVTHSSGNHAQALALAAKLVSSQCIGEAAAKAFVQSSPSIQSVRATIVMPRNTPDVKRNAVSDFGGTIVLVDNTNEAREQEASRIAAESNATFVHPSEDPYVIAGQGTVCLELIEQCRTDYGTPTLDVLIIPVGGGGLAAGNVIAARHLLGDQVAIVLAEPTNLDDAHRSFMSKSLFQHHAPHNLPLNSVADGLKTTLGPNTWPIIRDGVNDVITVSEHQILLATKLVWERLKICIEPSAGVGVAVLLSEQFQTRYPADTYRNVGVVLCGGNVDIAKVSSLMLQMGI